MANYKVLTGINYPVKGKDTRAEAGAVVSDIPVKSPADFSILKN